MANQVCIYVYASALRCVGIKRAVYQHMMERDSYSPELKSAWLLHGEEWDHDIVRYVDESGFGICVTDDKYHLKSRVIPRGCRPKHPQEVAFKRHFTELIRRIGLQGGDGYGSAEELANAFQHVINQYYFTSSSNALDVLTPNNDSNQRSHVNLISSQPHGADKTNPTTSTNASPGGMIDSVHGDRWNSIQGVTEYYIKFSTRDDPIWCAAPSNIYDHPELARYVYRKSEARQPILTKKGYTSIQRMIDNVEYIWNIQLLRNRYPELARNPGTNILESFHSVWNSTSLTKGSIAYARRKRQLQIRVWQRNTHYLFAIVERAKKAGPIDQRHTDLQQSLVDLYALPDNNYPSHNWLPINGPAANVLWLPWKESIHTAEELAQMGYQMHRSLRLGDVYAIDILSMMYEIGEYTLLSAYT